MLADPPLRFVSQERLLNKVWRYSLFLYFGTMIVVIAPRLAPASLPACYDLRHRLTGILFAVVTLAMQAMLARVLERRPAPAPRLTPLVLDIAFVEH